MQNTWKERGMFSCSEQRLCDQARVIRKNEWLSSVELESTDDNSLSDVVVGPNDEVDEIEEENDVDIVIAGEEMTEDKRKTVEEIKQYMKEKQVPVIKGLKQIDTSKLNVMTQKVHKVLKYIETETISETNRLFTAVSYYIGTKMELKPNEHTREEKKQPWCKRRLVKSVNKHRKDINILKRYERGENASIKTRKYYVFEEKYRINGKALGKTFEELKQRLSAKATKIKRCEQRIQRHRQNRMFQSDQKKVLPRIERSNKKGECPDAEESKSFWTSIWANEKEHKKDAVWLEEL